MPTIERLTASKWLLIAEAGRVMRRFVGSRDECEAVKAEWLAGNFSQGKADSR